MWPTKYFNIFSDISTHCNAGCPQCHRTEEVGLKTVDWLPLINWSLEDFKKAYRPSTLNLTMNIGICGTWGDPIMNKDIFEICKYIIDVSKFTTISINTNGSIRNEEWWWNLGVICGNRLRVEFAIDGKDQEQHEIYRRFTNLDKILDNMKSLSLTKSAATAQTLVFKHNQNDLKEIKEMCLKHGAKSHHYVWSDRFEKGEPFKYIVGNTEYQLEEATLKPHEIHGIDLKAKELKLEKGCISCKWLKKREVVVNPDGQVLPCCYLANGYYKNGPKYFSSKNNTMVEYKEQEKEHNIFFKPLEDILKDSKWFNEQLPESWESETPIKQCVKFCGEGGKSLNKLQRLKEK